MALRLTRKRAIELSIELWKWLAETGGRKGKWPGWLKHNEVQDDCFLCEYDHQHKGCCDSCPIEKTHDCSCYSLYFVEWDEAKTPKDRKKYAALFLKQLEEL